jgi:hypothetical protein
MLFGVISHPNMSTSLCFDGLRHQQRHQLMWINPVLDASAALRQIKEVDAAILVRHLYYMDYPTVWREAVANGVPLYYLADDNFVLLRDLDPVLGEYTRQRLRNNLRLFQGVLVSTAALATFYRHERLHRNVMPFTAIRDSDLDPSSLSQRDGEALHVGCFGGSFRSIDMVLPALQELALRRPVYFFSRADAQRSRDKFEKSNINLVTFPTTDDAGHFIRTWRGYDLDVVVHPSGHKENAKYKTANALLVSYYLGATPIVTHEPAYAEASEREGVTLVKNDPQSYFSALEKLLPRRLRHDMFSRLEIYVRKAFDPEQNVRTLDEIAAQLDLADLGGHDRPAVGP